MAMLCVMCACSKKYEIEQMQGEKVVSRSRGFTVDTCVSGKTANEETPIFNGLSTGAKVGTVINRLHVPLVTELACTTYQPVAVHVHTHTACANATVAAVQWHPCICSCIVVLTSPLRWCV